MKYKGVLIDWDMGDVKVAKMFVNEYLSEYERDQLQKIRGEGGSIFLYWMYETPIRFSDFSKEGIDIIFDSGATDHWSVVNYLSTECKFFVESDFTCTVYASGVGKVRIKPGDRCLHANGDICRRFKLKKEYDTNRTIPRQARYEVLKRQNWKCNICNKRLKYSKNSDWEGDVAHIDHIHPFSKRESYIGRGINELSNLQALCPDCNMHKHKNKIN